jgi:hypothetical protein
MRNRRLAGMGLSAVLVLSGTTDVEAVLRTDRLSPKALETWNQIVGIVRATDAAGRPVHPTLRALWDAVDASDCAVFVELPEPKGRRPYIVGQFAITRVAPEGQALEAVLVMNLTAIDHASAGPGAAKTNGFIPFAELGRKARYAEVLGHELAHAAWTFVDAERTRLVVALPDAVAQSSRRVLVAMARGADESIVQDARELERLSRQVEEPAEAAEETIWAELVAAERAR